MASFAFFSSSTRILTTDSSSFDPRVFWSVNALLITTLLIVLVWCFRGGAERISTYLTTEAAGSSDAAYLQRVRERRQRKAEEKKETPQERMAKLKRSFSKNKVHMIVQPTDFVEESVIEVIEQQANSVKEETVENGARIDEKDGTAVMESSSLVEPNCDNVNADSLEKSEGEPTISKEENEAAPMSMNDATETGSAPSIEHAVEFGSPDIIKEENNTVTEQDHTFAMNAVETGAPGYIQLRLASGKKRAVPNCCAVCLCTYEQGETVVWSSNRACKHAFHEECVMEWLIKMQDGTPCPCCRQEFTDLEEQKQMKKVLPPRPSFDVSVIHL